MVNWTKMDISCKEFQTSMEHAPLIANANNHGLLLWGTLPGDDTLQMWDEIDYQFPNFNGCTVEVWEWINNFIPHLLSLDSLQGDTYSVSSQIIFFRKDTRKYPIYIITFTDIISTYTNHAWCGLCQSNSCEQNSLICISKCLLQCRAYIKTCFMHAHGQRFWYSWYDIYLSDILTVDQINTG